MDAVTFEDLIDVAVDHVVATPGSRITEAAIRRPGSDLDLTIGSAAAMGEEVVGQLADVTAGLALDTAEGEALDRFVFDLPFPVERNPAAPALTPVRFTRPAATAGAGTLPAGTRVSFGGVVFRTLLDAPVGSSALTVDVDAQAENTGPGGNLPAGQSGTVLDTVFDTTFTVTNTEIAAGGRVVESDASLKSRARELQTAPAGLLSSIENGAKTVDQVVHATAAEELDADGIQTGYVSLVISDANGNSNSTIASAVSAVLDEYRGAGIPVTLQQGVARLEDMVFACLFAPGFDTNVTFDQGAKRALAYVNTLDPEERFYPENAVSAFLGDGNPATTGLINAKLLEPSGPVQPAATEVIRSSRALISQGVWTE